MQLAMFRELRQARKHAAELTAQLTQAKKTAEQQRCAHDLERQLLQASLAAARQQSTSLETTLLEAKTLAATQMEADAQTAERLTAEILRADGRIDELEREANVAAVAYQKTMEQLQESQRKLIAVDAARVTAEARSQSLDAVYEELDAEKKRNAALLDKAVELGCANNAQRAEHERELMEARQQTATERQQTSALRVSLREAMTTVRQQRDQLDNTALSLSMARAAIDLRVNQAKIEKLTADLSASQKELASRTTERDHVQAAAQALFQLLQEKKQQLTSAEEDLSKHKALLAEHRVTNAQLTDRTVKLLEQLLRIRTHKDWRL